MDPWQSCAMLLKGMTIAEGCKPLPSQAALFWSGHCFPTRKQNSELTNPASQRQQYCHLLSENITVGQSWIRGKVQKKFKSIWSWNSELLKTRKRGGELLHQHQVPALADIDLSRKNMKHPRKDAMKTCHNICDSMGCSHRGIRGTSKYLEMIKGVTWILLSWLKMRCAAEFSVI